MQRHFTASVLSLGSALCGFAALLVVHAVDRSAQLPLHLPVSLAFLGLLIAGLTPLQLEVESNTFTVSLTDIPIAVALLSMQRVPLIIAGTAGTVVTMILRKRPPLKLFFNSSSILIEMTVAAAIFDLTVKQAALDEWSTWSGLVLGMTGASLISGLAINVVIYLAGDTLTPRQAVRHSLIGLINTAAATILTLMAVMTLNITALAVVPLALLGAVSIIPLRRYASLSRRYDGLLLLHEFTAGLSGSSDLDSTLAKVLSETSKVLRANDATIVLTKDDEPFCLTLDGAASLTTPGDALWRRVVDEGEAVVLSRSSTDCDNFLETRTVKDLMAVPLVHGDQVIGAIVVANRLGDTSSFDADDLSIFGTMANQTTVTLENMRLIGELRDESAERKHQALHDELTGLPNRAHLYTALDQRLSDGPAAVAVLDLNRFKEVNDTLGHHVGDEVLVQTAHRLRHALPSSALVARLGGDEFAIVLFGISRLADAIGKLSALELAFTTPIELDAMSLRIDASIGVAISPDHGTDRATLLRHADVAMYAAKAVHGTTVRAYDRSQERSSKRSLELVGELRKAIENDDIAVAFQPKADLATGCISGAESLARWYHDTLGQIPPNEFIPIAEQAGLIDALTNVVLRRSLEACAHWRTSGHQLTVAVNVDAQTLLSNGFVEGVLGSLERWLLPAQALTIEITERELVRELEAATKVIDRLRSHGIALSIDDFGTGYSSLAYLSRLPVDEVKIDRAFVMDLTESPVHEAIIRAIVDITDKLGATTVVEGIEDEASWNLVTSLGVTVGQGYHLARPMDAAAFSEWLTERARVQAATQAR